MLGRIETRRKLGSESFHSGGESLGFGLTGFWQWAHSDLVSNTSRGCLAEFLVAQALGLAEASIRNEWNAFDLKMASGVRIEIKSAAYIQSWHQRNYSDIIFSVPKTRAWDAETNVQSKESKRQADLYVFALLAHRDKATIDPLDVDQWLFFVLPTTVLNSRTRSQHSITLKSLEKLCRPVKYMQLAKEIDGICAQLINDIGT